MLPLKIFRLPQYAAFSLIWFGLQAVCHAIDDDGNGLSDVFEREHGGALNPTDDTDADGFSNFQEYLFGGNPLLNGDLVEIFTSVASQNDVTLSWLSETGLRYVVEVSDGLDVWTEDSSIFIGDGNMLSHIIDFPVDPNAPLFWRIKALEPVDTDSDLLNDWEEAVLGSDALKTDSDGDELLDGQEFLLGLSPILLDSDGDFFSDDAEFLVGSDATDPHARPFSTLEGRPPIRIYAPSSQGGELSAGVTQTNPPVYVTLLRSLTGNQAPSVTVARPPIKILVPSSQGGELSAGVTLARPPVNITLLSSLTGNQAPSVTVASPPIVISVFRSDPADIQAGVTVGNPPVQIGWLPE